MNSFLTFLLHSKDGRRQRRGDGAAYIATQELKHLMTHIGDKLTEDEVMTIITAAGKGGDETLTYDEFVKITMKVQFL